MVTTVMDHITFDRSLRVLEVNARTEEKIVACVELESYFNHLAESNTDVTSLPIRSRYEKLMNILLICLEKDNGKMHLPVLQVLKLAIQVLPKGLGAGMKMASQCYSILLKTSQAVEGNVENSPSMKILVELFRCLSRFDDPQFIDAITTATTLGYRDHKELVRKCIGENKEDSEGGICGVTDVDIPKNTDNDTWILSLRLESLRFTSRLIKLCGSSLFKSHFVEEMDFWLDILLPSLFLFQEDYSSNLQKDCDADARIVTREALQCILALAPGDEQMKLEKWPKIKKDIKDNYADRMVKVVGIVPDWAPIWCTVLDVLGGELIRKGNNHLINKLLNVEERAFKFDKTEVRVQAFICWRHLIDKFLPPGIEVTSDAVQRSVRLLIQPLQPNNAKTDIMSRQKLNTWWHLIRHLESDIEKHLKIVLLPFLSYCFGSAKSKEIPPGKKFASIHIPCARVLANILNLEPAKKQIIEKRMDLTNVEECVVLPCSIPLLKSPTLFLSVSEELLHCVGESIVTLSCRSEIEVCSDLLITIWHSLLHHVSIVMQASDIPSEKSVKLIQDLLRLMQSLIERCSSAAPALARHIINLLKSMLMDQHALSYSVLSSPSYYVGSVQLMTGTPALFLVELMVSRPLLQLAMSNEKYIPILKVVLDVGVNHHEVLEFTQSVLKQLETVASAYYNVNTVERASLCVVWSNVALALTEYLKQNSNVNQGDSKQHDLSCFYLILLFPFYHLYSISYKQTVEVLEVWRELYRTFHHAAVKSIPTLDANEICETVSLKISQALMKHWPSTAGQALPLLEALQNIVTTIPFGEICRQSSKSKTKFLLLPDRGRSSKPTSYITYTMSLIVKVAQMFPTFNSTGEWYNTVGSLLMNCLEALFKNMKAANVGAAVPMVSGLSDSVLALLQASPLDDGTARFWTESLQRLWKCYFSFIETYLPQKSVKDFLGWMSGLLEAGFKHSDDEIRNLTVAFWDKIVIPAFAHDKTNAPQALKEARERCVIKEKIPASEPSLADEDAINETFMTINNNNNISLSSLSGKVFAPSDETDKMKPHQSLVQQLTDEGHILTKHQKEVFRRRKEDIPALYSSTLQPPQEDSMMSESSQDTSEFVVPSHVVETSSTVLNSGEFKEPFPPSFKVLEPPSCLRRTADYRKKMMIDNDGSIVLASIHDTTASADDIPCETLTSVPEEIVADPHSQNSSQTPVSFALVSDSLDPGNPRKLNLESVAVRHLQPDQMNDAENAIRFSLSTPTPLTVVSSVETPISFPLQEPAIGNNVVIGNNNVVQSHNLLAPYREVSETVKFSQTPLKILTDKSTKNVAVVPKSSGIHGIIPDSRKLSLSDTNSKKVVKNPVKKDYNKFTKEKPKTSSGNTFTPVSITVMEESEKDRMRRTVHLSLPPPSYVTTPAAVCPKKFVEMPSEDVGLSDIAPTIIENDNEILEASSMSSVEISTSENDAPLSPVKVVVEKVEDYSLAKTTYAALETMTPVFNIENDKVALQVEVSSSSRRKLKSPLRLKPGDPILPPFKMQNVGVPQPGYQTNSKISSPTAKPEKKKENEVLKSIRQVSRTRRGRVGAKREHIKIALGCNLSYNTSGENSSPSILTAKTRRNYKPRKSRQSKLSDIAEDLKVIKEASMPSDVISDNSDNKQIITNSGISTPLVVEINSKNPITETIEPLNILKASAQKSAKQESETTSKTSEFESKDVIDASDETQKKNGTEHETHKQESIQPVNEEETSNLITKSSKSCKEALLTTGSVIRKDTKEITQMSPKKKVTNVAVEENGTPSKLTKDASVSKKIRLDLTPEKKDIKSFPKVKFSPVKDRSIHIDKSEPSVSSSNPRLSRHRKSLSKLVPEILPMNEAALPSIPSDLIGQEISGNKDAKSQTVASVSSNIETTENVMGKRKRTKRKIYEDFICLEDFIPKERRRKLNDSVTQISPSKSKTQSLLEITQVTPSTPEVIMDVEGDVPETLEDIEKEVQALTALSSTVDNIPKNDASKQSSDISLLVLPHALEVQSAGRDTSNERSLRKKHLSIQDDNGRKRQLTVAQDKHTTNITTESNMLDDYTNKTPKCEFSNLFFPSESDIVESTSSGKESNEEETSHKDNVSCHDLHISDSSIIILSKKMDEQNNGTPKQPCVALTQVPENNLTKNESNEDSTSHKKQMSLQDKHISDISKNEITKHSLLLNSKVPNSLENKSVEKHSTEEKTSQKLLLSNQIALISDKSVDDPKKVNDHPKEKTPKCSSARLAGGIDCNEERTSRKKLLQVQDKNFSVTSSIVSNDNHKGEAPKCSSIPSLSKLYNSSESRSARKDNNEERTLRKKRLAFQNNQVSEASTVVSKKIDSDSKHEDKKSFSPSLPKVPDSSENKSTRKDSNKERTSRKKQLLIQDIPVSDVSTRASKKANDALTDKTPKGSALPLHKMPDSSENKSQGKDNKETRSSRRKQVLAHDVHISKVETSKHSSSTPSSKTLDSSENKLVGKYSNEERSSRKKRLSIQDKHVAEASTAATPLSRFPDPSENKSAVAGSNEERSLRKRLPVKDKHLSDASALASKKMDHNPQDEIPECCPSLHKSPDSSENKSAVNDSNEVRTSRKKRLPILQDRHISNVLTTDSNKRNDLLKVVETAENKPAGKGSTEEKKSWKKHISGIEDKHIFNENQTTLNVTISRKLRSCNSKPDEILKGDVTNLGESMAKTSLGILKIESDSKGQKDGSKSKKTSMSETANDLHLQLSEAVTEMTAVKKHKKSLHDPNKEEGKNSEQIQKSTNKTSITKENAKFEVTKDNNKTLGSTENLSQDNDSLDIIESSQESTFLFRRPKIHECSVSMRKIDPILQAGTKIDVSQGNQKYTVLVPEYPYSPFKIYSPEKMGSLKEKEANQAEILLVSCSPSNELEALKENVHKEEKSKSPKECGKEIVDKSEDLILLQKDPSEVAMNDADKNVMKDVLKMKTKRGNNQKSEVKAYIPKPKSKQHNDLETVENNTPQSEVTSKPEESPGLFATSSEIAKTRSRKTNSIFEDSVSMKTVDSMSRHRLKKHDLESISSYTKDGNKLGKTETASVKTQPNLRNEVEVIKTSDENPTLQSEKDISNRNAENEFDVEKDDKINSRQKQQNSTSKSDSVKSDLSKEHSKLLQQDIAFAEDAESKVELENNTVSVAENEIDKSKTKQTSLSLEDAASSKDGVVSSIGDVVKLRARHHSKSEELAVTEADQNQKTLQQFDPSTSKEAIKSSGKEQSDSSKSKEVIKSSMKDTDQKQSTLQHSDSSKSKEVINISVKDADQKQSTLLHSDSSKSKEVIKSSMKDGDQKQKILKQSDSSKSKGVIKSSMKNGDQKHKILQQSDSSKSKEVTKTSVKDGDQKQKILQQSDFPKSKEVIKSPVKDDDQKQNTLQCSDSSKSKAVIKSSMKDDDQKQNTLQCSDSSKSKVVIKSSMKDGEQKQKILQQSDSSKSKEVIKSTMKDRDKKQKILQQPDSSKSKEVIKSSMKVGNEKQKQSDSSKSKEIIKSSVKDGDKKQKQSDSSKSKEVISSSAKDGHQNRKTLQQSDSSKSEEVIESSVKDGDQKQKIFQHSDSLKPKEVLKSSVKDGHQNQKALQQSDSSKSKEVAKSPVKYKPKSEENMQNNIEVTARAKYSNPQESIDLLRIHDPIISSSMSITEKEFNLNAGVDLNETLILLEDESLDIEVCEYNKHAEPNDHRPSLIKSKEIILCRKNSRADINLESQPENADIMNKDKGLEILESNVTSTSLEPMICRPHEKPELLNEDLEDEDQSIKMVVSKIKKFAHYSENCSTRKNQEFHTSMESTLKGTSETENTLSPSPPRSLMDSPSSLLKAFSSPSGRLDLGRRCHQRRMGGRAQYLVGLAVAAKEKNQKESLVTSPVSSRRPEELRSILAATPLSRKKLLYNMSEEDVDDIETPTFERLQSSDIDAETPLQYSPVSDEPRTSDVPLKRTLKLSSSHVETPPSKKKKVSFSIPEVSDTKVYEVDETQSGNSSCPNRPKSRSFISMKRRERKLRIKKLLSTRSRTPPQDDSSVADDMSSQNQDSPDLTGLSSQGSVDMLMDYLNSQDVFFPPLISCMHPIESIAHHLTTHVMWTKALVVELNRKGIRTVADLSRLDEASISRLPVAAPKIARTKEVLESYYKIIEPRSDNGDSKQDESSGTSSSSSQMSDSTRMTTSDVVKYITSNNGSLTAILEEVSRLSPWKKLNQEICQFVSKRGGKVSGVSGSSSSEMNSREVMDPLLEQVLYSDSSNAKHTQGIVMRWLLSSGVNNVIKNLPQVEVARHIVKHYPDKLTEALSENPNFEKKLLQDFFNSQLMSGELPFTEVFDKLAEGDKDNLLLNAMQAYLILKRSPEEILQRMPMESVMQYATSRLSVVDKIGLCVQGILSDSSNQEIPLSHYQRLVNAVAKKVSSSDFTTIHYQVMMDLLNKK